VFWGLNHDLVRAYRVHAVKHAHGLPVFRTLDEEDRRAIVKHPGGPCALAVGQFPDSPRGEMLVARAESAIGFCVVEIRHHPPFPTNHPSVTYWIESKLCHCLCSSVVILSLR